MLKTNRDSLVGEVEKILNPFLVDYQERVLMAALARIPRRRAEYEAEIDRENALGELSIAVKKSGLSLREQKIYFKETKKDFIKYNRGRNGAKKQHSH